MSDDRSVELRKYFLKPGYIYVPQVPTLISTVLGSAVAVCLRDVEIGQGGMAHFLYPKVTDPRKATALYGNAATLALIRIMLASGSRVENLEAQIFGGASLPHAEDRMVEIARDNVRVAQTILARRGIHVVSEDVGGNRGRKIVYNSFSGEVVTMRVERIRRSDWYPYNHNDRMH